MQQLKLSPIPHLLLLFSPSHTTTQALTSTPPTSSTIPNLWCREGRSIQIREGSSVYNPSGIGRAFFLLLDFIYIPSSSTASIIFILHLQVGPHHHHTLFHQLLPSIILPSFHLFFISDANEAFIIAITVHHSTERILPCQCTLIQRPLSSRTSIVRLHLPSMPMHNGIVSTHSQGSLYTEKSISMMID